MTNKELEKEIKALREMFEEHIKPKACEFAPAKKVMNECSWEEIIDICDRKMNTLVFDRDDYKEIELKSGEIVKAKIIGTHHDYCEEDKEYTSATLMFTIDGEYEMNEECTNDGGWTESKMRTVYMERIYRLLPDDVKKYIRPVNKITSVGGGSQTIAKTIDKLFLLSEVEYNGETENSASGEGVQYEYFKNGGRLPEKWNWLRSPYPTSTYGFSIVYHSGYGNYSNANLSSGVCPCFAISNR